MKRAALLCVALLLACGRAGPVVTGESQDPTRIDLRGVNTILWTGERDTVSAGFFNAAGTAVPAPPVHWDTDDPSVVAIDQFGVMTAVADGRTRVNATSGALMVSAAVDVRHVATFELNAPTSLQVNESAALRIVARDSTGRAFNRPPPPTITSSDTMVIAVTTGDTLRARRRGTAHVAVQVTNVATTWDVDVRARFGLSPSYPAVGMEIGDTVRFSAIYSDVNGVAIPETPVVTWRSNNPDVMVAADGRISAAVAAIARISAVSGEDTASTVLSVSDFRPGQLTSVRYIHAMKGVGSVTASGIGDPVTMSYGESVDRIVSPGWYLIRVSGMPGAGSKPQELAFQIRDGDHLIVLAVATPVEGLLTTAWGRSQSMPAEWGGVRIIQGSVFPVYYVRPKGDPAVGLPDACYFDLGNIGGGKYSAFSLLSPGNYDIILATKFGLHYPGGPGEIGRLPMEALTGRSITVVLVGNSAADASLLSFIEP